MVFIGRVHRQVLCHVFAYGAPNAFDRLKFSYVGPEKPLNGVRTHDSTRTVSTLHEYIIIMYLAIYVRTSGNSIALHIVTGGWVVYPKKSKYLKTNYPHDIFE